jgi:hypothetical protein
MKQPMKKKSLLKKVLYYYLHYDGSLDHGELEIEKTNDLPRLKELLGLPDNCKFVVDEKEVNKDKT